MSFLLKRALGYAARKIAADPRAREKAGEMAKSLTDEVKTIAREEDRAYAAGRSVRRLMKKLKEPQPREEKVVNPRGGTDGPPRLEQRGPGDG